MLQVIFLLLDNMTQMERTQKDVMQDGQEQNLTVNLALHLLNLKSNHTLANGL